MTKMNFFDKIKDTAYIQKCRKNTIYTILAIKFFQIKLERINYPQTLTFATVSGAI